MKTPTLTPKLIRQRKMLLVLPGIVLTFLTLFFWSLGGGKDIPDGNPVTRKGLNTQLPDASLKGNKQQNKMSYYEKAAADSQRIRQLMKADPYYRLNERKDSSYSQPARKPGSHGQALAATGGTAGGLFVNTHLSSDQQVYDKLVKLQKIVNTPAAVKQQPESSSFTSPKYQSPALPVKQVPDDPELKQMNVLLEKIMDIQHPERVGPKAEVIAKDTATFRAIPAVIDGKQKITQGTVVRLRMLDGARIGGVTIPKGQLIYGSGSLYNQRYTMVIRAIRLGYNILPVNLTVFDMTDGLEGISVPEAVTGEAAKEGAASGVQGLELMSFEPSVSTQLAGAGINAAKGLFSKKVRLVKGKLKDGHLLLLRDNSKPAPVKLLP